MEIVAVYQDCVLCGTKGRQKIAEYAENGIQIRKVGFATEEGRELCATAIRKGIGSMPFYVCEGEFATRIDALIAKPQNTTKKPSKKQKKVKESKNGNNTKNQRN